ncbi:MAG: c-type cytochrome [Nitrospirae bacterium]|nr:c-type cytochrome [Candidatus Manganitrophaceae bacterium]
MIFKEKISLMSKMIIVGVIFSHTLVFASEPGQQKPLKAIPKDYAEKVMPSGWWTDKKIIAEGKKIFENTVLQYKFKRKLRIADNGCATCHGIDEKKDRPKKRGSPDFRISKKVNRFSDAYWFWRISEGVAKTRMPSWKAKLSEADIWKVISYQHTWSHGNKPALHDHPEIEYSVQK